MNLLNACKVAQTWFEKMTNDEPVWEEQPPADMATIMFEAIRQEESGTLTENRYGKNVKSEPKPLAQYLAKCIECGAKYISDRNSLCRSFEQALDAYESTENVVIQIIKKKAR